MCVYLILTHTHTTHVYLYVLVRACDRFVCVVCAAGLRVVRSSVIVYFSFIIIIIIMIMRIRRFFTIESVRVFFFPRLPSSYIIYIYACDLRVRHIRFIYFRVCFLYTHTLPVVVVYPIYFCSAHIKKFGASRTHNPKLFRNKKKNGNKVVSFRVVRTQGY